MTARLLDGRAIAQRVRAQIAREVEERVAAGLPRPGLATVLAMPIEVGTSDKLVVASQLPTAGGSSSAHRTA